MATGKTPSVYRRPNILTLYDVKKSDLEEDCLFNNKFTEGLLDDYREPCSEKSNYENSHISNENVDLGELVTINTIADNKWLELSNSSEVSSTIDPLGNIADLSYVALPSFFTTLSTWPTKTNLWCWSCHQPVRTRPIFIPRTVEKLETENNYKMKTLGCFGHWCCAQYYIDREFTGNAHDDCSKHLLMLYYIFTGKRALIIRAALPTTERKKYKGENGLSDQQYKKKLEEIELTHL